MPITWRNIGSTVSGDEASLLTGAQDSMTAGFGALNKVLEDRQKTKDDNWDQGKTNNTNAFMNKLTGAETPEELAEMQKRGEFQAMMSKYGAQIDQDAARTALDGRGQVLQDRRIAGINYNNDVTTEQNKAARAELLRLAQRGDQAGYDAAYANTDWADPTAVAEAGEGAFKQRRDESRADYELRILQQNANTNTGQLGVAQGQLGIDQAAQALREEEAVREANMWQLDFDARVQAEEDAKYNRGLSSEQQGILARALDGDETAIQAAADLDLKDEGKFLREVHSGLESSAGLDKSQISNINTQAGEERTATLFRQSQDAYLENKTQQDALDWAVSEGDKLVSRVSSGELSDPVELSEAIKDLNDLIASDDNMTETDAISVTDQLMNTIAIAGGTTQVMQAQVALMEEDNERALGLHEDPIYQAQKRVQENSPGETTVATLGQWFDDNKNIFEQKDADSRARLANEAYQLATGGLPYRYRNGEGAEETVNVQFDQSMLELMAMGIQGNSGFNPFTWSLQNSFEDNARRFLDANPQVVETTKKVNQLKIDNELTLEGAQQLSNPNARLFDRLMGNQ